MTINQFEIVFYNDDGSINKTEYFKSIRQMSNSLNIPYHTLKTIAERENKETLKYKNTLVNGLLKRIKINKKIPIF
jgi:hypothetical protein